MLSSNSHARLARLGMTLVEMVIGIAISSVLFVGLTSSLYIAAQSLDVGQAEMAVRRTAQQRMAQLHRDVESARNITELTATSVTLTVPDRNGDETPETIRYAWSGTAGDPLTQQYNGGAITNYLASIDSLTFEWESRMIEGAMQLPAVLFVSGQYADGDGGTDAPTAAEQLRIDLMEGWGYDVTVINQSASQSEFDDAMEEANVVYVSGVVNGATVGAKLNATQLGVVTESYYHAYSLGFSGSSTGYPISSAEIAIIDTEHYITSGYTAGSLNVLTAPQMLMSTFSGLSPDATSLANVSTAFSFPTLITLDQGDQLARGGTAAGRRCQLPWGENGFDPNALNAAGQSLMRRSIEWAAGANGDSTRSLLMLVADLSSLTNEEAGRKQLIESWGYAVTCATASEPQSVYDTFPGNYDLVYVPASVAFGDVTSKLKLLPIGVVNEVTTLTAYLGFTSGTSGFYGSQITVADNTHYITAPYSTGDLTVTTSWQSLCRFVNSMGPGFQLLGARPYSNDPVLMTLDAGDELLWGGAAPARRVMLPWGSNSEFDVSHLNTDGKAILRRAIDWAGEPVEPRAVKFEEFTEAGAVDAEEIAVSTPPGTVAGDLLIAAIVVDGDESKPVPLSGSGWNYTGLEVHSDTELLLAVMWKIADASEPATHVFAMDVEDHMYAWIMRFTGHNVTNPIDVVSSFASSNSDRPFSPALTTTTNDAMVLRIGAFDDNDINVGAPGLSGHTPINMGKSGTGKESCSGGAGFVTQDSAGSSGTSEFSLTSKEQALSVTIAIAPE